MGPKRSLAAGKGAAEGSGGIESVDRGEAAGVEEIADLGADDAESSHADSLPGTPGDGDAGSDPDRLTPGGSGGIE
jgi:hypothetical protein